MSCEIYANNSLWGSVAAASFGLAIFLSYMPQLVTIAVRQTIEGINPYFLMLMNLGSSFAFGNVLVLSRPIFSCCKSSIGAFDCFGSLLGAFQLFAGFLGPVLLLTFAVRFRGPGDDGERVLRSAKFVAIANIVSWVCVISVTDPVHARQLATILGLMALSVGFVQYFPQLYTTYKLKHTGSLSVTMMLFQIPGGYIWCLSLAMRKGSHWSTWISTFAAATFQLILLIMALYYTLRKSTSLANRLVTPPPGSPPPEVLPATPTRSPSEATPLIARD